MIESEFEWHCERIHDLLCLIDSSDVLVEHATRQGYSMADVELQACDYEIDKIRQHITKLRGLIANVRNGGP